MSDNGLLGLELRLFDITAIPNCVADDPRLAFTNERWCTGSGVPGDNCEFGHPVDAEFADVAWRSATDARRDTSRREPAARPMCHRCEITRRNWRDSLQDGDESKARTWISTEARKYSMPWGCTPAESRFRFEIHGITLEFMTAIFKAAKERGTCPDWRHGGCGLKFSPGPHDITGDVKDPIAVEQRGYMLCDDIHAQCFTCNRSKNRRTWNAWLRLCAYFERCKQYKPQGWQEHIPAQ